MKKWMLLLFTAGCFDLGAPKPEECIEFNHRTSREGAPTLCRMVWCETMTTAGKTSGGVATLWCDTVSP